MSKVVVRKNLNRWFKEKWVDVSRRDKDGKHPPCGRKKAKKSSKGYPKCRPSVKVSSKTPKTSGQMTSGQKRAATKRKRSKKQGVGGKPTIVKGANVLKGRGKIRIPTKRKRRPPVKNPSKAKYRYSGYDTRRALERAKKEGRQVVGDDGELKPINEKDVRPFQILPMAHMRMQEQQYTQRGPKGVYVRTYPEAKRNRQRVRANEKADEKDKRDLEEALSTGQVMDFASPRSKGRKASTIPVDAGPPSKFRRGKNLRQFGSNLPFFESVRVKPRRPFALVRPGFRTGGGETLPLPDTAQQRQEKDLQEVGEELMRLYSRPLSRTVKVNFPARLSNMINERADIVADAERARYQEAEKRRDRAQRKIIDDTEKQRQQLLERQSSLERMRFDEAGNPIPKPVVKQDYPFVAMAEDERQLPVPMHTNRPRSTHPGFSRTDVFQVPTGVGIPTPEAAPRTVPVVHAQGRIYPIADREQYERALRAPDEETRRAAMNEVPRVMTQGVQSGQNVFRMPTFYGMPYNEDTYFTTGEPMNLAFRLLKDDNPFLQNLDERIERVKQQHLNAENAAHEQFLARKFLALEQARNRMLGYSPRPFAEFSHEELESLMHDETGMQTPDQRKDLFNEVNTRNMENLNQFSDEFQDIHTGEPMDLAFRLLKRDMSHCNCNAPKGFSCRAHCKSKEKR